MLRLNRFVGLVCLALVVAESACAETLHTAAERLKSSDDFRVRVQAALELGKSKSPGARQALERALDDRKAAVRAAAAAALRALSDERAVPALRRHRRDASADVRSEIESSLRALQPASPDDADTAAANPQARLLVKLGSIKNGTSVKSGGLVGQIEQASREKLGRVPGVQVIASSEDVNTAAKRKRLPAVMVTGRLRRLNAARDGEDVVYSAMVDYVVHRMPEQSILSVLSGSASAKASPLEARDERKMAELRSMVLDAAIESAMRRAPQALEAAME